MCGSIIEELSNDDHFLIVRFSSKLMVVEGGDRRMSGSYFSAHDD